MSNSFLTKDDTKIMKGVAIIMMLAYHLWAFPGRIAGGMLNYCIVVWDKPLVRAIGEFGDLCVPLFFFLGGYGIYLKFSNKGADIISRIKKIYMSLWKVFLIFIPLGFVCFGNQIKYCQENVWNRYADFSIYKFLLNFIGISCDYNSEWWFLWSYVCVILTFPIARIIINKHSLAVNVFMTVLFEVFYSLTISIISTVDILSALRGSFIYTMFWSRFTPYCALFYAGMAMAKDDGFRKLNEMLRNNNVLSIGSDIIGIGTIFILKEWFITSSCACLYVILIIAFSLDLVSKTKIIKKVLSMIGNESTNMWLIHSFFCYYFYGIVKIVVYTRWAVPSLITLIVISYVSSVMITKLWNGIDYIWHRVFPRYISHNPYC